MEWFVGQRAANRVSVNQFVATLTDRRRISVHVRTDICTDTCFYTFTGLNRHCNCVVLFAFLFCLCVLCTYFVMYNVLSGLAACGRLGVAARPACLFGTRPVARDQRHASHVGATPAD